jgi:hypothetical protein
MIQAGWIAVVLALLVLLVPRMNVAGAAVALLLGAATKFALTAIAYRVALREPVPNVVPELGDLLGVLRTVRMFASRAASPRPL